MPTGKVATAQCRSGLNSRGEAKSALLEQLDCEHHRETRTALAQDCKEQVGSGMRGDKIRTYRFQDDVVKDHNSNRTASVAN